MSLPKDIHILVSMLNMRLRDDDMSLETIVETNDEDYQEIITKLKEHGFVYDEQTNSIKSV